MKLLNELIELAKGLSLLYVEDDEELRTETCAILEHIFTDMDAAADGRQALEMFSNKAYDLIITDIEMPRMNGLLLSSEIRKIAPALPIVVVSAYSNTGYLLESIAVGISHYILKPIQVPLLVETLYTVAKGIVDTRLADEYRKKEMQEHIIRSNEKLLEQISSISPNPVIIYNAEGVVFFNNAFKALFEPEELQALVDNELLLKDLINRKISVDLVLQKNKGFIEHLDALDGEGNQSKIAIKTPKGRKIFLMIVSHITLGDQECIMYTFNDITLVEYQKVQIDNYNEYMSELAYTKYKAKERTDRPSIINKTTL